MRTRAWSGPANGRWRRLLHAMGDVHPHALEGPARAGIEPNYLRDGADDGRRVASDKLRDGCSHPGTRQRRPSRGKTIFCNSGFEAVEAALKTAMLATGKPGVIAFEGGYHGLGYGALNATHREHFRSPLPQASCASLGTFVPFPGMRGNDTESDAAGAPARAPPLQTNSCATLNDRLRCSSGSGRSARFWSSRSRSAAALTIPPPGFLPLLRRLCDEPTGPADSG